MTFGEQAIAFVMAGAGMGLVFAPSASALLSVVSPAQAGQASGTNNAIREVGGVFGVAVLATIFSESGALHLAAGASSTASSRRCGSRRRWSAVGAAVALLLPRRVRQASPAAEPAEAIAEPVAA